MHELAVTQSILEIVRKHAESAGASRVTDIHLSIGDLSTIVDDSVQFYWNIITEGTICEGSSLHFSRIKARIRCQECQAEYTLEHELTPCPKCGSNLIKIIAGEEFQVESMEIEKESEAQCQPNASIS
jgi:hydrogenase nickel incorporation protein HypA/HybF